MMDFVFWRNLKSKHSEVAVARVVIKTIFANPPFDLRLHLPQSPDRELIKL